MNDALTLFGPLDGFRRKAASVKLRAARLVRAYPRETVGAGVLGFVTAVAIGTAALSGSSATSGARAAPPAPPPLIMRQSAPDQAVKINAEIPMTGGPNPAAAPFVFKGNTAARAQALNCLASATYYEAGNQDADGERAVAQVVLNRVRHPAFPGTVCGVVYQGSTRPTGCQFTFTCDGSLNRQPDADGWRRATEIAAASLGRAVYGVVGWAIFHLAEYVVFCWGSALAKGGVVGA